MLAQRTSRTGRFSRPRKHQRVPVLDGCVVGPRGLDRRIPVQQRVEHDVAFGPRQAGASIPSAVAWSQDLARRQVFPVLRFLWVVRAAHIGWVVPRADRPEAFLPDGHVVVVARLLAGGRRDQVRVPDDLSVNDTEQHRDLGVGSCADRCEVRAEVDSDSGGPRVPRYGPISVGHDLVKGSRSDGQSAPFPTRRPLGSLQDPRRSVLPASAPSGTRA